MENNEKIKEEIKNNSEPKIVINAPVFNEIQEILTDQEMIQKKLTFILPSRFNFIIKIKI